jgi:hypothetical protein
MALIYKFRAVGRSDEGGKPDVTTATAVYEAAPARITCGSSGRVGRLPVINSA